MYEHLTQTEILYAGSAALIIFLFGYKLGDVFCFARSKALTKIPDSKKQGLPVVFDKPSKVVKQTGGNSLNSIKPSLPLTENLEKYQKILG